jgi:hypothetical protein
MARKEKPVAKKQPPRKLSLDDGATLLRERFGGRLKPPLAGLAYRFTIWLPVQAIGQPVFSDTQRYVLRSVLDQCFGGFSQTTLESNPPWFGSWLPDGAEEPVVDFHIQLVIYALQDAESIACIRQLKWLLQQEHIAAQEIVLIEQVPVQFVEAAELS